MAGKCFKSGSCFIFNTQKFDLEACFGFHLSIALILGVSGTYQTVMKMVELDLEPEPKCEEELRRTRLGTHFSLHKSFTCAKGKEGTDSCTGKPNFFEPGFTEPISVTNEGFF